MSERPARRNEALRDGWFAAANAILASEGYGALKLAPLCRRLGVTTGSFYHSFDSWQDFTDSLLDNWLVERTEQLARVAEQVADPEERLTTLIGAVFEFDHRAEAAIRVWAGVDPRVAAVQRKVDQGRLAAARGALVELVGPELAEPFAVWGLGTAVGYEMLSHDHPPERLHWAYEQLLGLIKQLRA